jgi:ABC-type antimicrobial peptide transport system permease subunit
VNQLAVKHLGLDSPIGESIYYRQRLHTIIGVVQDFYSFPIKWGLAPLILHLNPENDNYLFIKLDKDTDTTTLQYIRDVLKRFNPDYPVSLQSLEDFSVDEDRILPLVNKVMIFLTFLGIFISCLGLFSLASFMCEQRTKEIGIRKTLGASISNVILLLTKEYIKLLFIANLIAIPVTFFAVKNVLAFFAYRIDMKAWIFIVTGTLVLFLAMVSVIFQTIKAALLNPVDSLRYE